MKNFFNAMSVAAAILAAGCLEDPGQTIDRPKGKKVSSEEAPEDDAANIPCVSRTPGPIFVSEALLNPRVRSTQTLLMAATRVDLNSNEHAENLALGCDMERLRVLFPSTPFAVANKQKVSGSLIVLCGRSPHAGSLNVRGQKVVLLFFLHTAQDPRSSVAIVADELILVGRSVVETRSSIGGSAGDLRVVADKLSGEGELLLNSTGYSCPGAG